MRLSVIDWLKNRIQAPLGRSAAVSLDDAQDPHAEWVGKVLVLGAAFIFANVSFAALRFVSQQRSGVPSGYQVNLVGAVLSVMTVLWFAHDPLRRLTRAINLGLALVTVLLLAPAFYGYVSSPWWLVILPLASSAVLSWRQSVAWGVVAGCGMVFGLLGVPALGGATYGSEPLAEAVASRVVLAFLVTAIALGVRRLSDRRAASLLEARRVLERTNAHLAEVSAAKNIFLATVSHEMRTPLNGVIGMTSLTLEEKLSPVAREYVQMAHDSGVVLLAIINDILDFTKIESGALTMEQVSLNLHTVVVDAVRPLFAQAVTRGLDVSCSAAPGLRRSRVGDPTRVRQIIGNIVGNAVKFTERGSVRVRLSGEAERVRVEVCDSGIGIAADKLDLIFDPFSQVDSSVTRLYGGTGLGLSIVRQLARGMGGGVEVSSRPGEGSTFVVTLQLAQRTVDDAAAAAQQTRQVLLVGDGEDAVSIAAALTAGGAEVRGATVDAVGEPEPCELCVIAARPDDATPVLALSRRLSAGQTPVVLVVPPLGLGDLAAWREAGVSECMVAPLFSEDVERLLAMPPAARTPAEPASVRLEPAERTPPRQAGSAGPRVLVVEDDEMSQMVLCLYLEKLGCHSTVADNGVQGLDLFARGAFDVVITDISMPLMDGCEMLHRIREHEEGRGRHTPIVALTAHAMHGQTERFIAEGFDICLTKPISDGPLEEALRRLCPSFWEDRGAA